MNNNWQTKKLGEICTIKPSKNEVREKLKSNDFVSFVPMKDLNVLSKDLNLNTKRKIGEVLNNYTYFANNDVLLAKITPCFENGKLGIARNLENGAGFGSSEFIVFRPDVDLLSEYLFYFLSSDSFRKNGKKNMSGAVGHKRVSKEFVENYLIALPPLPEQKRIVKILDEAFAKIDQAKANAEKNLANSRELFESYLNDIFANQGEDWEMKRLRDIANIEKNKNTKRNLPYVGMEDIESNTAKFLGSLESKKVKSSSFYFSSDLILYGRLRPYLNKILLPNFEGHCSTEIFPIKIGKEITKHFLFYWFLQDKTVQAINKTCTGARMPRANMNEVFDFFVSYPKSLSTQKSIVAKLDKLSAKTKRLEEIYQQKIDNLEELKKSVLKKAFAGEL